MNSVETLQNSKVPQCCREDDVQRVDPHGSFVSRKVDVQDVCVNESPDSKRLAGELAIAGLVRR